MSRIISYRGKLAHDAVKEINLGTNDGKTGYKIIKMQLLGSDLTGRTQESVVKVYSVKQTGAATGVVDFDDVTLLAAGFYEQNTSSSYFGDQIVVFDKVTFNQNIFISHDEAVGSHDINYHLELEQMDLTEDQALVAIVKNLRNEQ
jgi:hypothetical protein